MAYNGKKSVKFLSLLLALLMFVVIPLLKKQVKTQSAQENSGSEQA